MSVLFKNKLGLLKGLLIFCMPIYTYAETSFNAAFLNGKKDPAALEAVQAGYAILPGNYAFAIYINKEKIDTRDIIFYKTEQNDVVPCIDDAFIKDYGIIIKSAAPTAPNTCIDLEKEIENAKVSFDAGVQRLDLSIPQINLVYRPRGYVPEKLYNEGISALLLNYNMSGSYTTTDTSSDAGSVTGIFNGGINIGAWRYRNQSSYIHQSHNSDQWENVSNKIERDILAWRSRLEIGDSHTNDDLFDSFSFRGAQLSSDTEQLPYSLQNYAPVVRGIATSNARVEIRQNGYLIYSTNVAPGAFEITDIVSATDSGDLQVKVVESDGSTKTFMQPYSAVPKMLREGIWKYQLTTGEYRTGSSTHYKPSFVQATVARGMGNYYTPYAGVLVAKDYFALGSGLGLSLGKLGAVSFDVISSHNKLASGGSVSGNSFRFLYSKSLNTLGTDLKVIGYRYSSRNYYDFADAVAEKDQWQQGHYQYSYYLPETGYNIMNQYDDITNRRRYAYSQTFQNKKNQLQISLNQSLGDYGQIYTNITSQNYWNSGEGQRSLQVGYNTYYKSASIGVYYQYTKSQFLASDYVVGVSLSIPFGGSNDINSTSSYEYNKADGYIAQTGVSGSFLKDKNLQINAQAGVSKRNSSTEQLNLSYQGAKSYSSVGYSTGSHYQQYSANVSGGILLHSGGITLGQSLLNNPILIEAKGAEGVRVENQTGVVIDSNGYALVSSSSPYRRNRLALAAEDLGNDINITNTIVDDIVPTKRAIVKVTFDVTKGISVLAHLKNANDQPIVLGATVYNKSNKNVGMVGVNGSAYITGVNPPESLVVRWGNASDQQCHFTVPTIHNEFIGYAEVNIPCLKE